jgi:hypothetical protein
VNRTSHEFSLGYSAGYADGISEADDVDPINGSWRDYRPKGDWSLGYQTGFVQGYDDTIQKYIDGGNSKSIDARSTALYKTMVVLLTNLGTG